MTAAVGDKREDKVRCVCGGLFGGSNLILIQHYVTDNIKARAAGWGGGAHAATHGHAP